VDAAGYKCLYSEGVNIIQGQHWHAHSKPHIQHESTFLLGDEQLAVRWYPYGLYIRATVLPSPKAMGCARYPPTLSLPCVACGAKGGMADFRTTTSGAAPTCPPEGVFSRRLRKKYRLAVGTHYGQTRVRQAGFSLCHRRDGRAGTTILQLVSVSDDRTKALLSDYGPAGLLEQGQRRRIRRSSRTVLRDHGPKEAASSRRRAVGTAGPFQGLPANREQRTPPTAGPGPQYLLETTDPLDGYAGGRRGRRTTRPRDLQGAGRRVSPMLGILGQSFYTPIDRQSSSRVAKLTSN
jgi:hypothetical protein